MNSNSRVLKSDGMFSTRRLGLAGLAGIAACGACCSVPLLVAAGVGGGALTTLAAFVKPGAELAVGLGAAGAVLGVAALRSRRRAAACAALCTVPEMAQEAGAECKPAAPNGCAPILGSGTSIYRSPTPSPDEPIVRTADGRRAANH